MTIGIDASNAGYPLVPDSGADGKVKYGAREINRTRDFIAQVKALIPTTIAAFRLAMGFSVSEAVPLDTEGNDGDIMLVVLGD